jgi:hypothetical protein
MKLKLWMQGAAVAAAMTALAGSANAVTIDYSFTNTVGNVAGTVTGQIDGLVDNATSAATAIYVDTYPAALSSYPTPFNVLNWTGGAVGENSFTLSGGVVTQALFDIFGANGVNDQLYLNSDCSCSFGTGHTNFLDIGSGDSLFVWNVGNLNAPDGLILGNSAVPEPATWAMMLVGFAGLGTAMRSRRKSVAAAA